MLHSAVNTITISYGKANNYLNKSFDLCLSFRTRSNPEWIKSAVFYQIYPSSYQVSNSYRFGDIKGVQARLYYIKSIGVNAIWFNPKLSVKGGFHIDFFSGGTLASRGHGGDPAKSFNFDKQGMDTIKDWHEAFQDQYDSTVNIGYVSTPWGYHDGNCLANKKRGDTEQLKVAMIFSLTNPGIPFIHYVDEPGMKFIEGIPDIEGSRNRLCSRTPMQWHSIIKEGFSGAVADKIYIPLDPDLKRPTVTAEDNDPNSL